MHSVSASLDLPQAFLERMERLLGDEFAAFLASYTELPVTGLRANTLKVSADRLPSLLPFALEPLPWPPAAFLVREQEHPGGHPYHAAGLYYLQDPSAMVVPELLAPAPGERVLDLAAAPGGKATHIASLMANTGLLVTNEIHPRRVWDLAENLERWGVRNTVITNETPERLAGRFTDFFDRVLLDAPCSGEGMFRKSRAARLEWTPDLVQGCALRQASALDAAAKMVRPGGILVYSTCTFAPEENEGTLARFLARQPEFELIEPPRRPEFDRGRPAWVENAPLTLERAVRLWPHRMPGEGHFAAVLRRSPAAVRLEQRPGRIEKLPRRVEQAYNTFVADHLQVAPAGPLVLAGTYLYQLPSESPPDLTGLRFIHPGWWLGTAKLATHAAGKDRFEPAHSMAMALGPGDVRQVLDLDADSPQLSAYLRGESWRCAGDDGWLMVTAGEFPLGWARRARGTLKSLYPRGLRRP